MKRIILSAFVLFSTGALFAQQEETESGKGFKKENLFTGGGVTLSFSNVSTVLGATPHFGYSLTKWLDAAVGVNVNYISERDNPNVLDKVRQTIVGPISFVRIFPVNFLFVQAQYEHSFISQKIIPGPYSNSLINAGLFPYKIKTTSDVNSLLVGGGYTSGRSPGNNTFYYLSIMFDVLGQQNSPYLDNFQRTLPIIKAGINVGLFQGKNRNR